MVLKILGFVAIALVVSKLGIGVWYIRKLNRLQDKTSQELKAMILAQILNDMLCEQLTN